MDYHKKYFKYKIKYEQLKKKLGGTLTFDKFLYDLSQSNKDLYDLKKYETVEYNALTNIDLKIFDDYLDQNQECSKKFIEYIKYIYSNTIFFNAETIINQLNKNIYELKIKFGDKNHILCIPNMVNSFSDKSAFFYILYFINSYHKTFGKFPLIYHSSNTSIDNKEKYIKDHSSLFIFTDDILYSGTQMRQDILTSNIIELAKKYNQNISIYLHIVAFTETAQNNLQNSINKSECEIIFPDKIKPLNNTLFNLTNNFIKLKYGDINPDTWFNFMINHNMFFYTKDNTIKNGLLNIFQQFKTHLIYTFYKFPDYLSTYQNLCKIIIYDNNTTLVKITEKNLQQIKQNFKENLISNLSKLDIKLLQEFLEEINHNIEISDNIFNCKNTKLKTGTKLVISNKIETISNKIETTNDIFNCINTKLKPETNLYTQNLQIPDMCENLIKPFYKIIKYKYNDKFINDISNKSKIMLNDLYNLIK